MNAKRVSMNRTSVATFLCCLIFSLVSSPQSLANSPGVATPKSSCEVVLEQLDKDRTRCAGKESSEPCKGQLQKAENLYYSACGGQQPLDGPRECKDAYRELTQEESKMSSACGSAGISGDCYAHADKCNRCQGTDAGDPMCETLDTVDFDSDPDANKRPASIMDFMNFGQSGTSSASGQKYAPDPKKARTMYKNCPAMAGKDLKEWMDRAKDAQQTVTDKQKEIADLEARNGDIDRQLRSTIEGIDEDAQAVADDADTVRQEMNQQMRAAKGDARNRVAQLLDSMDRIEEQIISTNKAYDDAYNAYLNALAQLDQQCHAAALNRLSAMQTRMQNLIDKSTYSVGSFNDLVGKVGVSDRKKSQAMLNRDFNRCKNDPSYKASADAAKRALDSARKAADNAIASLRKRQDAMSRAIQDANERELPEQLQEILAAANDKLKKLQNKLMTLATRKQNAIADAAEKKQENMKLIMLARQEADVAQEVHRQYQAYLNEKMVASGGIDSDGSKVSEAINSLGAVRGAAHTVVASCNCDMGVGAGTNVAYCRKACTLVYKASDDWDSDVSISDSLLGSVCDHFGTGPVSGRSTTPGSR